jgi:hypothetical protein
MTITCIYVGYNVYDFQCITVIRKYINILMKDQIHTLEHSSMANIDRSVLYDLYYGFREDW